MKKIAVFPGSFDPITNGHLNLIERASALFDKLIILIAESPDKKTLFTVQERTEMIEKVCEKFTHVEVDSTSGLLVNYAQKKGACVVVRGLRATSDFEYEFQMASMNKKLNPKIETFFMMTGEKYFYISSRTIKEVVSLGGSIDSFVPQIVAQKLKEKFS
ncbi:MAG: pantetheine-phosphate adenylyltransferase [Deltaproteobacteria bacterium]|nr:pantetheine-phosphate adenylyltransferase [Deltaproteobacteria bacterium]